MKYIILILFLSLCHYGFPQLTLDYSLKSSEQDSIGKLSKCLVEIYESKKLIKVVEAKDNGRFFVELDFNQSYELYYKRDGYNPLLVNVDCTGLSNEEQTWIYELGGTFSLELEASDINTPNVSKKISFNRASENFEIE